MSYLTAFLEEYFGWISIPNFRITDALEIIILAFLIYKLMLWIKNSKAWLLMKGLISVSLFILLAAILQMKTILWLAQKLASVIVIGAVIIFQPEIRRALERLGEQQLFRSLFPDSSAADERELSDHSIGEILKAVRDMAKVKTGALIVIERRNGLAEYERTGIYMDSVLSRQLIQNIFEHNTPLHDGAIIIRGNRIMAATCYLPLSDSKTLSKELGTRHRAALGLSEVSDALVLVVSEETGAVSYTLNGKIYHQVTEEELRTVLNEGGEKQEERRGFFSQLIGRESDEA